MVRPRTSSNERRGKFVLLSLTELRFARHRGGRFTRCGVFAVALVAFLAALVAAGDLIADGAAQYAGAHTATQLDGSGPDPAGWLVVRRLNGELVADSYADGELDLGAADAFVAASADIITIERDALVEFSGDFYRSAQWHLDVVPFELLHPTGDGSGVTVAIVDTAIALGHEDLDGLLPGWDAIADRPLEPSEWQVADADHGSHVAGLLAATPNNDVGGVGVAPGVQILPIRVLHENGGFVSDVVQGILWAIAHDADIINLSLGTSVDSSGLRAAVEEAEAAGIVVIAASGNHGLEGSPVRYPAAIDTVIAVGAVDEGLSRWPRSSRASYLDVVAPGAEVLSLGGGTVTAYRYMSGTSMATPQVAGLVALLLEASGDLTPAAIRSLLRSSARDLGPVGHDPAFGYGLIDPVAALLALAESPPEVPPPAPGGLGVIDDAGGVRLTWDPPSPLVTSIEVERDGLLISTLEPTAVFYLDESPVAGALHVYTVTMVGEGGRAWSSVTIAIPEPRLLYWIVTDRGRVLPFGATPVFAGPDPVEVKDEVPFGHDGGVIGGRPTLTGEGYWLVDVSGRVAVYGDAEHHGDVALFDLNEPIVGMSVSPTGAGYWLVARDGGVFAFGDAVFYGSTGAIVLNEPIVDMSVSPTGAGYWLVARDGGVFAFGDAVFYGSTGAIVLNEPMVSMTVGETGYWLVASDGGVFTFEVPFYGSIPGLVTDQSLVAPGIRVRAVDDGAGYVVLTGDGALYGFGSAGVLAAGAAELQADERAVDLLLRQF